MNKTLHRYGVQFTVKERLGSIYCWLWLVPVIVYVLLCLFSRAYDLNQIWTNPVSSIWGLIIVCGFLWTCYLPCLVNIFILIGFLWSVKNGAIALLEREDNNLEEVTTFSTNMTEIPLSLFSRLTSLLVHVLMIAALAIITFFVSCCFTYFWMGGAKTMRNMEFVTGMNYFEGQGVPEDKTEGVKWFRKAAEHGLDVAQYNLGYCYYFGNGVPEDRTEGVKWIRKAAEQGHEGAIDFLREIDSAVASTPEQVAHLRVLAARRQADADASSAENGVAYGQVCAYHANLSAISLSGCSSEFRSDFVALINSVAQFIAALDDNTALQTSPVEGFFIGMVNALGGEMDGGASRMLKDFNQADQKTRNALLEWRMAETALKKYE